MVDVTTRTGKGSPLTNAEIDTNFSNLKTAVEAGGGVSAGSATPLMNGAAAAGVAAAVSHEDHVHPTDTSRQAALV